MEVLLVLNKRAGVPGTRRHQLLGEGSGAHHVDDGLEACRRFASIDRQAVRRAERTPRVHDAARGELNVRQVAAIRAGVQR